MKTNNVDFGKSFNFKVPPSSTVYTCHKEEHGRCKITWIPERLEDDDQTDYRANAIKGFIQDGDWVVLPTNMKEIVGHSGPELIYPLEKPVLNKIKEFTATSNHCVFILNGSYEVYRSGEDIPYKCADDEALIKVMKALSILDEVTHD